MNPLVHWEIPSTNLAKSTAFYRKLFGWKMKAWGKDYVMFDIADSVGGGITKVKKVPKPCIGVYVGVELPKTPIGRGLGYTGAFLDPCGCMIGLWSKR